jgi:hypothetical protein
MGKSFSKSPTINAPVNNPGIRDPRVVLPRDQIQDWHDPYIPDGHYPDGTVCTGCGAVYNKQHWNWDDRKRELLVNSGAANEVCCPACRQLAGRDPQGVVTLRGDYWPKHREEIMNLVHNEEGRGTHVNPLERVMSVEEQDGALVIQTTTEKLAQRIGRAIHKAHKGEVEYKFGETNQVARVYWERSLSD